MSGRPAARVAVEVAGEMFEPDSGDDLYIDYLFSKELTQKFETMYLDRHDSHRRDYIGWILQAYEHHRFSPATALRAVAYCDQYLSVYNYPANNETRWRYLLLAMACLSVAAKMGEPRQPSLVDLQIPVNSWFSADSVMLMEINVLRRFGWNLHRVTPFDFRDYFLCRLPPSPAPRPADHIAFTFSDLAVKTIPGGDFQRFMPSEVAAAAVILAAGGMNAELPDAFYEGVNKATVTICCQQLEGQLMATCLCADCSPRSSDPPPAGAVTDDMSTGGAEENDQPEGPRSSDPPPAGAGTGDMSTGGAEEDDQPESPVKKRPRLGTSRRRRSRR